MKTRTLKLGLTFLILATFGEANAQLGNSNMTLLAWRNQHLGGANYSACWGYRAPNGREYAILGCGTGTAFVEITDTTNIVERDYLPGLTSGWREMKVYSNYAYIVSEATGSGLQIVNLQYLPDSVQLVATYFYAGYTRTHSISQSGPYLYLNGGNNTSGGSDPGGITALDLTVNPQAPVRRGSWSNQYVHDCRVRNDTIWACNIYSPGTISVINAVNKDNLTTITSWVNNPNPFPHNCDLLPGRTYILTTDETSNPVGKLKVWNISNLSNVLLVTSWQPTGITTAIVHNVERFGNYAVIAHYRAGVRVVNISNPASPTEVAWYDTYPSSNSNQYSGCWGVFTFPSGKIIASDMQTGLYVLKTTFNIVGTQNNNENIPQMYTLGQNYPNPFNPSTTIKYSLPKNSYVTMKVYDLVGRQVGLLVDEYKSAGEYSVNYDASLLSSGVYFYTLEAEGFAETKKLTLIK
jgi:choice-of-anchor B domain-containing protein